MNTTLNGLHCYKVIVSDLELHVYVACISVCHNQSDDILITSIMTDNNNCRIIVFIDISNTPYI